MKKIKPTIKYTTVSIAQPFYDEIKEHVKQNKRYASIADFVRQGVRELMNGHSTIRDESFSFCPFCGKKLWC